MQFKLEIKEPAFDPCHKPCLKWYLCQVHCHKAQNHADISRHYMGVFERELVQIFKITLQFFS